MYSNPSGNIARTVALKIQASHDAWCMAVLRSLMASLKTTVVTYLQTSFVQIVASSISMVAIGSISFICADLIMINSIGDITIGNSQFGNIFVASAWITGMIVAAASDIKASGRQIIHSTAIHHIVQENF